MRISKWLWIGLPLLGFILLVNCEKRHLIRQPTEDDGSWFVLSERNLPTQPQHLHHARRYGRRVRGFNYFVLKGIDKVQATAPDGGGYFTGKDAKPTESPIGYELQFVWEILAGSASLNQLLQWGDVWRLYRSHESALSRWRR